MTFLLLTPDQMESMRAHVAQSAPLEACGLLAGTQATVSRIIFITNQARSPVRFRMDPAEQLKAFAQIETDGLELLGIFHSHPSGPAALSATDIAEAAYEVIQVIWSCTPPPTWTAHGFIIENGKPRQVALQVTESE